MIYLGIDPGRYGAIAYVPEGDPAQAGVAALGSSTVEQAATLSYSLDTLRILHGENTPMFAVVERATSRPGQGVASTFTFGTFYGVVLGALAALNIPYELVLPRVWRKGVFGAVKSKDMKAASLEKARQLFPHLRDKLGHKKDHNKAEALLIAWYAVTRREYGGER